MKDVGTLQEIGAQVGDAVQDVETGWAVNIEPHALLEFSGVNYRIISRATPTTTDTTAERTIPVFVKEGYDSLFAIFAKALHQAQDGKGDQRHASGQPFTEQPIFKIGEVFGMGFQNGQALKKMIEAQGMIKRGDLSAAEREILGAINYLAATAIEVNRLATECQS